jgi:ADP-ribose pyrophosphatase
MGRVYLRSSIGPRVLQSGRRSGVVECAGCVGVLPFLDAETVALVGQYRHVFGGFYWEMPTGAMRHGESEEAAVQRELAEEAGYQAERLVKVCASYHTSKSVVDETANIYLAEGLRPTERAPDPAEFITQRAVAASATSPTPAPSGPGAVSRPPRSRA